MLWWGLVCVKQQKEPGTQAADPGMSWDCSCVNLGKLVIWLSLLICRTKKIILLASVRVIGSCEDEKS